MAAFHQTTGLVQHHIGHFDVALGRFVEGRCHHFGLDAALHVGHFFRTLVNQQHDFVHLRMIVGNGIGDGLQEHGLTGFGLCHDKAALSLADGREHIHHADALVFLVPVSQQVEFLRGEEGCEEIEGDTVPDKLGRAAVDELDLDQREVLVAFARGPDFTGDGVAVFERILLDLLLGNVDIVRRVQVIVVRGAQESVSVRHHLQHTRGFHGALEFNAGLLGLTWLLRLGLLLFARFFALGRSRRGSLGSGIGLEIVKQIVDKLLAVHLRGKRRRSRCTGRSRSGGIPFRSRLGGRCLGFTATLFGRLILGLRSLLGCRGGLGRRGLRGRRSGLGCRGLRLLLLGFIGSRSLLLVIFLLGGILLFGRGRGCGGRLFGCIRGGGGRCLLLLGTTALPRLAFRRGGGFL